MLEYLPLITALSALYLLFISLGLETRNTRSMIAFKLIPFILGLIVGLASLQLYELI